MITKRLYLTAAEVSTLLGMRLEPVYRAADAGILPHLQVNIRPNAADVYRFHPDAIRQAWSVTIEAPDTTPDDEGEELAPEAED